MDYGICEASSRISLDGYTKLSSGEYNIPARWTACFTAMSPWAEHRLAMRLERPVPYFFALAPARKRLLTFPSLSYL